MKKYLEKIIAVILVFVISLLSFSSCDVLSLLERPGDSNKVTEDNYNSENQTENQENEKTEDDLPDPGNGDGYYAFKALFSYEDVTRGLGIVRQRCEVEPRYTVKNMGDKYTVIYYFAPVAVRTYYPIEFENFFSTMSYGEFLTYIFLNDVACPGHKYAYNDPTKSFGLDIRDEDWEKTVYYIKNHACVKISLPDTGYVPEIEDWHYLYYEEYYINEDVNKYSIYYGSNVNTIMGLDSCVKLDEEFFEDFFKSIVITREQK